MGSKAPGGLDRPLPPRRRARWQNSASMKPGRPPSHLGAVVLVFLALVQPVAFAQPVFVNAPTPPPIVLPLLPTTAPDSYCPDGYTSFAEACFKVFINKKITYTDAQTHCNTEGGRLAMPKNQATTQLLTNLTSFELTGIASETIYYIGMTFVEDKNRFMWNDGSDLASFTNWKYGEPNGGGNDQVDPVTNLLVDQVSENCVRISWKAPGSLVDAYDVTVSTENLEIANKNIASGVTTYEQCSLIPGETYNVQVSSVTGSQVSDAAQLTLDTMPTPPSNWSLVSSTDTIVVSWTLTGVRNSTSLEITPADANNSMIVLGPDAVSARFEGLISGRAYTVNATIWSRRKLHHAAATANTYTVPEKPQGLHILAQEQSLHVTWSAPSGIVKRYLLTLAAAADGLEETSNKTVRTSFTFQNLVPGRLYKITVFSMSNQLFSEPVSSTGRVVPAAPPWINRDGPPWLEIHVSWGASEGDVDNYNTTIVPVDPGCGEDITISVGQNTPKLSDRRAVDTCFSRTCDVITGSKFVGSRYHPPSRLREAPLPPTSVTIPYRDDDTITVQWEPPFGHAHHYKITHFPSHGNVYSLPMDSISSTTVRGSVPLQIYGNATVVKGLDQARSWMRMELPEPCPSMALDIAWFWTQAVPDAQLTLAKPRTSIDNSDQIRFWGVRRNAISLHAGRAVLNATLDNSTEETCIHDTQFCDAGLTAAFWINPGDVFQFTQANTLTLVSNNGGFMLKSPKRGKGLFKASIANGSNSHVHRSYLPSHWWTHLTFVYSQGNTEAWYVNGVPITDAPIDQNNAISSTSLAFGDIKGTEETTDVAIDDFIFYGNTLSHTDILNKRIIGEQSPVLVSAPHVS
ncbi:hypothetical protein Bbelb_232440 [Branchiostoma belcheri]|nr:hypothetical protein Bbelb_232440 [Branchiostoma belcheri]